MSGQILKKSKDFLSTDKEKQDVVDILTRAQQQVNEIAKKTPGRDEAKKPDAPKRVAPSAAAPEQGFSNVGAIAGAINVIFGRSVNANILEVNKDQLKTQKNMDTKLGQINEGIRELGAAGGGEPVFV